MRDQILQTVRDFLGRHYREGSPLLVGFSGGPDSLALVHLLLECRRFFKLDLHLAYVDHGWREESAQEALSLEREMESKGLPFYRTRLEGVPATEEAAREARLTFFRKLYEELGCQALLLGHQGDDQSETVLKRILEGASLFALGGIKPVSEVAGMQIWRPLLRVEKAKLRAWLDKRGLVPIEDVTNLDSRYLRGRMRKTILPSLQDQFGKEVRGNLRRLGFAAQELEEYLERRLCKYERLMQERGEIDLSGEYPFEPFELKAFLRRISEAHGIFLSYAGVETLYRLLEEGSSHRRVGSKRGWVEVHRRRIAIKVT